VKKCKSCNEIRDFIAFYKRNDYADGYSPTCRMCRKSGYRNTLPDPSLTEKYCPRCKNTKPVVDFGFNRSSKSGYAAYCKACARDMANLRYRTNPRYQFQRRLTSKLWKEENPERHKAFVQKAKERYAARKRAALAESRSLKDKALTE